MDIRLRLMELLTSPTMTTSEAMRVARRDVERMEARARRDKATDVQASLPVYRTDPRPPETEE